MSISVIVFVSMYFPSFFQGVWIVEILTSGSGFGTLLNQLSILSLFQRCHTQNYKGNLKDEDKLKMKTT